MSAHRSKLYGRLLGGVAAISLLTAFGAHAEDLTQFDIAPQPLSSALNEFATQSKMAVLFTPDLTGARVSAGLSKAAEPETALAMMLQGTGLSWKRNGDTFIIMSANDPQSASAAGDGADGTVQALIVTAQKREEQIQDVPIAISAFTEKSLQEQKIEGGFDLLKAIPNVTFSKNNFSSYNFSIRGVGTKAISVTTDPGVAVEFNDTPLIRNRLFEQEYFDVERVEVLRGPQGTLHGRNATAGVINVISRTPKLEAFAGEMKGEVGNYHAKRLSGFANIPLIEGVLGVRLAGALTNREGYDYNGTTKNAVNGRDLWSGRLTVGFRPTDRIRADLIWERFSEDDNRSRTGKQLCHRDPGPTAIGAVDNLSPLAQGMLSQGCQAGSLYDDAAFGTPNGLSIPFITYSSLSGVGYTAPPVFPDGSLNFDVVNNIDYRGLIIKPVDPYGGMQQSRDLRVINSIKDPKYRADTDVIELNIRFDISNSLTLTSQTAYVKDDIYSFQDFNRYNTLPIFNDTSQFYDFRFTGEGYENIPILPAKNLTPGGIFVDPQLGPSSSIVGFDISKAKSRQFSQEIRVASDMAGAVNFSAGANYTYYRTVEDYYVMYNLITLIARQQFRGTSDTCTQPAFLGCVYIDPNPVESIDGEGHNYFRSTNPYTLKSAAAFAELYWQMAANVKLTGGLRYSEDRKTFTPVPTQTLLSPWIISGGEIGRGYPSKPDIKQKWGELTGRLGVDWTPDLSFTDETMLYAFYSHGYKGGGANPPGVGWRQILVDALGLEPDYPVTFKPEYVDAIEIGAKNTLLGGGLIVNGTGFYYNYTDYQVSKIVDRTAANENFDATVWGLEFETLFSPTRDLRFNANLGYLHTELADGSRSIDLMDRLQGHTDYVTVKPFVTLTSNCVVPASFVEALIAANREGGQPDHGRLLQICPGSPFSSNTPPDDQMPNGGQGFYADVSGNQLPNAPHWTTNVGAQYGMDVLSDWRMTVRADAYWQSQSWARVYNAVNDKLHGWYNVNLSIWLERPEDDLKIEFYAKNLLDKTPITDAFLNSDDTALTTNVFVLDPRLIGLSIRKGF